MDIGTLAGQITLEDALTGVLMRLDSALKVTDDSSRLASIGIGRLESSMTAAAAVGSFMGNILATAFAKITGFVTNLVSGSLMAGLRLEQLGVATRFLGEKAGYSGQFIDDLAKKIEDTGIAGIATREAIQSLLGANIDLAHATKLSAIAQNMQSLSGRSSSEVFQVMTRAIATGNTELLRGIGFQNISIEGLKRANKAVTGYTGVLSGAQRSSMILNAIMKEGGEKAGLYAESMTTAGKQASSAERAWDQVSERIGTTLLPITSVAMKAWYALGQAVRDAVTDAQGPVAGFVKTIADGLQRVINETIKWYAIVQDTAMAVYNAYQKIPDVFKDLGAAAIIGSLGVIALSSSIGFLSKLTIVQWAGSAVNILAGAGASLWWALKLVTSQMQIYGVVTGITSSRFIIFTKIQTAFNAAVMANPYVAATIAIVALGASIYGLVQAISKAYDHWKVGQPMWDFFSAKDDNNFVRKILGWVGVLDLIDAGMKKVGDTAQSVWDRVNKAITDAADTGLGRFWIQLSEVVLKISGWSIFVTGVGIWNLFKSAVWGVIDAYKTFKGWIDTIIGVFTSLNTEIDKVGESFKDTNTNVGETTTKFSLLGTGITDLTSGISVLSFVLKTTLLIALDEIKAKFQPLITMIEWLNKNMPASPFAGTSLTKVPLPGAPTGRGATAFAPPVTAGLSAGEVAANERRRVAADVIDEEAAKYAKKVAELSKELREGDKSLKLFADAFKTLTPEMLASYEVQGRLIPQIMKLVEAGKSLTPAMHNVITLYQAERFALQEREAVSLKAQGLTLQMVEAYQRTGLSLDEIAQKYKVLPKSMEQYVAGLELIKTTNRSLEMSNVQTWSSFTEEIEKHTKRQADAIISNALLIKRVQDEASTDMRQRTMSDANFQIDQLQRAATTAKAGLTGPNALAAQAAIDIDTARQVKQIIADDELSQKVGIANRTTEATLAIKELNKAAKEAAYDGLASFFTQLGQIAGEGGIGAFLTAAGNMVIGLQSANKWATMKGGISKEALGGNFGALSVVFDKGADASQRFAAGLQSAAGIAQGAMNVWQATGQSASKMKNALSGAMAGAQAGAMFGPWGIAIGAAAGLVVGLVRGKPAWAKASEEIGRDFGKALSDAAGKEFKVSNELAKKIADAAKVDFKGDRATSITAHIGDIIKEAGGLNERNIVAMTGKLRDVFVHLGRGAMTSAQAMKTLEENWMDFAKAGTDATGALSKGLREVLQLAIQNNVVTKSMADYMKELSGIAILSSNNVIAASADLFKRAEGIGSRVTAAQDLVKAMRERQAALDAGLADDTAAQGSAASELFKKLDEAMTKAREAAGAGTDVTMDQAQAGLTAALESQFALISSVKDELSDLGTIAYSTFAVARAAGATFAEALKLAEPGLQQLSKGYKDLGIDIEDTGLKTLIWQSDLMKNNPALIGGISAIASGMTALGNMKALDPKMFETMQTQASRMYARIQGEVHNLAVASGDLGDHTRDALLPMQDYLHAAVREAEQLGIPIDAATESMVAQSKELNIWKDIPSAADKQELSFKNLTTAVERLTNALLGIPDKIPDPTRDWGTITVPSFSGGPNFAGIEAGADAAAGAVDTLNFGTSPGGLKEIPILLLAGIRAMQDFAARSRTSLNDVKVAADGLSLDHLAAGATIPVDIVIAEIPDITLPEIDVPEVRMPKIRVPAVETLPIIEFPSTIMPPKMPTGFKIPSAVIPQEMGQPPAATTMPVSPPVRVEIEAVGLDETLASIREIHAAADALTFEKTMAALIVMRAVSSKAVPDEMLADLQMAAKLDLQRFVAVEQLTQALLGLPQAVPDPFGGWTLPVLPDLSGVTAGAGEAADAVDVLNFGASPGGLKEIPILLAAGISAAQTFKGTAVDAFSTAKAAADALALPQMDIFIDAIARMGEAERSALEAGMEGFQGTAAQFLAQQAALYQHAQEGDARLRTWLSAQTLDTIKATEAGRQYLDVLVAQQQELARVQATTHTLSSVLDRMSFEGITPSVEGADLSQGEQVGRVNELFIKYGYEAPSDAQLAEIAAKFKATAAAPTSANVDTFLAQMEASYVEGHRMIEGLTQEFGRIAPAIQTGSTAAAQLVDNLGRVKTAAREAFAPASTDVFTAAIAAMSDSERQALEAGHAEFKGSIEAFLSQQALLYTVAQEGDSRLKTWLSSETLATLGAAAASDVFIRAITQMGDAERSALAAGMEGFSGTVTEFLAQQAALYQHAQEGDSRLRTWLSSQTLETIEASEAGARYLDILVAQQKAASIGARPVMDAPVWGDVYADAIAAMGEEERKALEEGHRTFAGSIEAFLSQQAVLYTVAREGDARLKTWLSAGTMMRLNVQTTSDVFVNAIAAMSEAERDALATGMEGFQGTAAAFLSQQALLYTVAQEGDARLKTWLSGATLDLLGAASASDVFIRAITTMGEEERNALATGMEGFKGSVTEFLAQQAALYQHVAEGDSRLKTWLSSSTLETIQASEAGRRHIEVLVAQQKALEELGAAGLKKTLGEMSFKGMKAGVGPEASASEGIDKVNALFAKHGYGAANASQLEAISAKFKETGAAFNTTNIDQFLSSLEASYVAGQRATTGIAAGFTQQVAPAIAAGTAAVSGFLYGTSPGGLKEIPILMEAARRSVGIFKVNTVAQFKDVQDAADIRIAAPDALSTTFTVDTGAAQAAVDGIARQMSDLKHVIPLDIDVERWQAGIKDVERQMAQSLTVVPDDVVMDVRPPEMGKIIEGIQAEMRSGVKDLLDPEALKHLQIQLEEALRAGEGLTIPVEMDELWQRDLQIHLDEAARVGGGGIKIPLDVDEEQWHTSVADVQSQMRDLTMPVEIVIAETGDLPQLRTLAEDADVARAAVDRLNFGSSPGGLKEIPLLLQAAVGETAIFAEKIGGVRGVVDEVNHHMGDFAGAARNATDAVALMPVHFVPVHAATDLAKEKMGLLALAGEDTGSRIAAGFLSVAELLNHGRSAIEGISVGAPIAASSIESAATRMVTAFTLVLDIVTRLTDAIRNVPGAPTIPGSPIAPGLPPNAPSQPEIIFRPPTPDDRFRLGGSATSGPSTPAQVLKETEVHNHYHFRAMVATRDPDTGELLNFLTEELPREVEVNSRNYFGSKLASALRGHDPDIGTRGVG